VNNTQALEIVFADPPISIGELDLSCQHRASDGAYGTFRQAIQSTVFLVITESLTEIYKRPGEVKDMIETTGRTAESKPDVRPSDISDQDRFGYIHR